MLKYYFDIYHIDYRLIGTRHTSEGYEFCELQEMDRRIDLRGKIHICQNDRYNDIGKQCYSLSATWFDRAVKEDGEPKIKALRNNLYNYFRQRNLSCDRCI